MGGKFKPSSFFCAGGASAMGAMGRGPDQSQNVPDRSPSQMTSVSPSVAKIVAFDGLGKGLAAKDRRSIRPGSADGQRVTPEVGSTPHTWPRLIGLTDESPILPAEVKGSEFKQQSERLAGHIGLMQCKQSLN